MNFGRLGDAQINASALISEPLLTVRARELDPSYLHALSELEQAVGLMRLAIIDLLENSGTTDPSLCDALELFALGVDGRLLPHSR